MENTQNITTLTDQNLLSTLKNLTADERKITTLILRHLREVERRRLHVSLGFSSLFSYCTQELGYSEASAQRRISAMRLLKEVPEVEAKISSGALNLSVISQVQCFFNSKEKINEPLDSQEKKEILKTFEHKSARETEREILAMSPPEIIFAKEKIRAVSPEQNEIKFFASSTLLQKLERLKSLMAHKTTNPGIAELVELMADLSLSKLDPLINSKKPKNSKQSTPMPTSEVAQHSTEAKPPRNRYIPAELRRQVWARDQGCCQYISAQSGKKCCSQYGLEIHHKHAFANGGAHSLENLTLHCFAHNQFEGVKEFGAFKVQSGQKSMGVVV